MEDKTTSCDDGRLCTKRFNDHAIFGAQNAYQVLKNIRFERLDHKWVQTGQKKQKTPTTLDKKHCTNMKKS
jgi:hypothetical protein